MNESKFDFRKWIKINLKIYKKIAILDFAI